MRFCIRCSSDNTVCTTQWPLCSSLIIPPCSPQDQPMSSLLVLLPIAQMREMAEAKEAELNARILQLESKLHWLQQDKQQLEAQLAAAAAPPQQQQAGPGQPSSAEVQVGGWVQGLL